MSTYKTGNHRRPVYTTMDGTEIHYVPFSWDEYQLARAGLMDEYRERGEQIDHPQYTVTYADGRTDQFDHDETSIRQVPPGTPADDRERVLAEQLETWRKYHDALKRFNSDDAALQAEYVYDDSLGAVKLPDDDAWEVRQRKRQSHIKIPTDPEEKRRHYINTVLLKSKADQIDIVSTIVAVSMGIVQEADLETIKASFRRALWGNGIAKLAQWQGVVQSEDAQNGPLDSKPQADTGEGTQRVAIDES